MNHIAELSHTDMFTLWSKNKVGKPALHREHPSWESSAVSCSGLQWCFLHPSSQGCLFIYSLYLFLYTVYYFVIFTWLPLYGLSCSNIWDFVLCVLFQVLSSMRVACICPRTYFNHQRDLLQPTILWQWRAEQQGIIDEAKQHGKPITLGGDMRADSPGL